MEKIVLKTTYRKMLSDQQTPVSIYLRLRDKYANSILLESSDYHGNDNSFSYICCQPIATFEVKGKRVMWQLPGKERMTKEVTDSSEVLLLLSDFANTFESDENPFKFINNGLFGYMNYDAVQYFEDLDLSDAQDDIPDILYKVYQYVVTIDHFKNELYVFEHQPETEKSTETIESLLSLIKSQNSPSYGFKVHGEERSNYDDEEFMKILDQGKKHCLRGDVFQIVLSRRFETSFKGDDFNVYRALRSINPSPYLFYFDYGDFRIFGSSPEAQIVIKNHQASIFPIAGTFRRTGDDTADTELAKALAADEKENSEHVMLVDLARNDLSRNAEKVVVEVFKEIQYYSHVIHLVSKVTGSLTENTPSLRMVADTFPAGTLSGAPKHMAMKLIDKYENVNRAAYGGAIGFLGFNGDFNHAIMIRSFLSMDNQLRYQAGAGVVAKSSTASELQEVNNKLAALRKAIAMAEEIN